ncbi:DDRGK domain-containing protein 1 [Linum perenne]
MEELFVAILSMLLVVGLIPLYIWKRRQDSRSPDVQQEEPQLTSTARFMLQQRETVVRATGASRTRMRRRPAAGASSSRVAAEMAEGEVDDATGKSSKKRDKKRQEREAQRQANEAARESRSSKQDYYAEMRRKKDEEHEAKERMLEEEAKARKAKEEEAAALEFQKWKGEFSVDDEGTMENEAEDGNQSLLSGFVDYIKKQKCVPLEDLAAEFKMRTQECINRITSLESMGRLSGVMDDRGKYIYISMEEMKAVADYIKREGRVSISHLASKSNQFIDLEPKPQFVEEIAASAVAAT